MYKGSHGVHCYIAIRRNRVLEDSYTAVMGQTRKCGVLFTFGLGIHRSAHIAMVVYGEFDGNWDLECELSEMAIPLSV
jgi:hypothetical protein